MEMKVVMKMNERVGLLGFLCRLETITGAGFWQRMCVSVANLNNINNVKSHDV